MDPLAGLTSSIGEGLTEFQGFQRTRTSALASTEAQVQSIINAADYDGGVSITLTSGTFDVGVVAGLRVRVLSGPGAGAEGLVLTVGSPTSLTLVAALAPPGGAVIAAFTGQSIEVVTLSDTTLNVESTAGFPSTTSFTINAVDYLGRIVLDERVYYYTGLTATSFTGLAHDNGTGTFTAGVVQDHDPLTEVDDYSRATSVLDIYRRSFLVNFATGEDLTVLGRNLGVTRPQVLADADYRALIKAIAYTPRGTMLAVEGALDALLGTGNWELFEDLTLASLNVGQGQLRNNNTLFFGRPAGILDAEPYGKTWADGYEALLLTGTDEVTVSPNDVLNVASLKAAPETSDLLIAEGTGASSSDGVTIDFPAASIPAYVYPGDLLAITSGPRQGEVATIDARVSATQVTLGAVLGYPGPSSSGGISEAFSGASWRVLREGNRWGQYLPEDESILEGGSVRATTWEEVGGSPLISVQTTDPVYGPYLSTSSRTVPANGAIYRRSVRIQPEDDFSFLVTLDGDASNPATNYRGQAIAINDGERVICASVTPNVGATHLELSFSNLVTNSAIGPSVTLSGAAGTIYIPGLNAVWIEKRGRGPVRLYRAILAGNAVATSATAARNNRELVAEVAYTSFPTAAAWAGFVSYTPATPGEVVFGNFETGTQSFGAWKQAMWWGRPERDWLNAQLTSPSVSGQTVTATGQFVPADVGRYVAIKEFDAVGAAGGNPLGSWLITAQATDSATVTGARRGNGQFTLLDTSRFIVAGLEFPFRWPDHANHSVQILTGVNAGTYAISGILDPETLTPYSGDALGTSGFTSRDAIRFSEVSNTVTLTGLTASVGERNVEWRLVPNFPSANVTAEVVESGTEASGVITAPVTTAFPTGTLMTLYYTRVLSAYLLDITENNAIVTSSPLSYTVYPAYLADAFGYVRQVVDVLTAAGVIDDFDSFYRDASGPHVRTV